jgi:hypothetical protein
MLKQQSFTHSIFMQSLKCFADKNDVAMSIIYMGMKRQIVPSSHFSLLPRVCVSSTLAIPTP